MFAVTKEQFQNLIPNGLQLDTFQDKWAFEAVAMVQTKENGNNGQFIQNLSSQYPHY